MKSSHVNGNGQNGNGVRLKSIMTVVLILRIPRYLLDAFMADIKRFFWRAKPLKIGPGGVFGYSYYVWRRLQHGQELIERFGTYFKKYGNRIRHQTGHEHRCSVGFNFDYYMMLMRKHIQLDELLLTRCIAHHDEPEGLLIQDICGTKKKDADDLREYLAFKKLCQPLGHPIWEELQKAFLLQFCLKNPKCFPHEDRVVMARLAGSNPHEALFFQGCQQLDYFYSAWEFYVESGVAEVLVNVVESQSDGLDEVSERLPGFKEVVWTSERRSFFKRFAEQHAVAATV